MLYVYLKNGTVICTLEPFRKIICNPIYFLILSYISPNAFIGKNRNGFFPMRLYSLKKNDALRIHIFGMVLGKKNKIAFEGF